MFVFLDGRKFVGENGVERDKGLAVESGIS